MAMLLLEVALPFDWWPKHDDMGNYQRYRWGPFAVTTCPRDENINTLFLGLAKAGVAIYRDGEWDGESDEPTQPLQ